MSFQHYVERTSFARIDQVTNEVSNSPAQTQTGATGHQVSIHHPLTALAPPLFPSRPGTSILINCRSEGSLTVAVDNSARHRISKDVRRMSLGQYHATTAE
jgi:hypothetical protein